MSAVLHCVTGQVLTGCFPPYDHPIRKHGANHSSTAVSGFSGEVRRKSCVLHKKALNVRSHDRRSSCGSNSGRSALIALAQTKQAVSQLNCLVTTPLGTTRVDLDVYSDNLLV